jgi:tetratricopeptide (TPR) repeat protein
VKLAGQDQLPSDRKLLIRALLSLGQVHSGMARVPEADAAFEEAVEIARRALPSGVVPVASRRLLADVEMGFGLHLLRAGQRSRAAELALRRAELLRAQLVKELPNSQPDRRDLAQARQQFAAALRTQQKKKEAIPLLEQAEGDMKILSEGNKDSAEERAGLLRVKADLALVRGQLAEAVQFAEQLAALKEANSSARCDAAAILTLCAAASTKDTAGAHTERALQFLQELVKRFPHDFRLADRLQHDPDFQSLRQHPEFQKVRNQMPQERN